MLKLSHNFRWNSQFKDRVLPEGTRSDKHEDDVLILCIYTKILSLVILFRWASFAKILHKICNKRAKQPSSNQKPKAKPMCE